MSQGKYLLILVGGLSAACLVAGSALAAKGGGGKGGGGSSEPGTFFDATFGASGLELDGAGTSNETAYSNNIANLVFNKLESDVQFNFYPGSSSQCSGSYGTPGVLDATMHLLDTGSGFAADNVVARLWFQAGKCGRKSCKYVLDLFEDLDEGDTEYGWDGGIFPPFDNEAGITRSAGSWQIRSNGGAAGPCVGEGGTFDSPVLFTVTPQ